MAQASEQLARESLQEGFQNPPDSAKPRVWWHWLNGNVTKEGTTADLEWMKRVGIGGMQMFDVNPGTPVLVAERLVWMTPEWKSALKHAAAEADRLGLEMAMHTAGGDSETGAPWVKPSEAMKKFVWSDIPVRGPAQFAGALPQPPAVRGPFQNVSNLEVDTSHPNSTFYADIAVVAYRVPTEQNSVAKLNPRVTTNAGPVELVTVTGDDPHKHLRLPYPGDGQPAWVQFEFPKPFRTQAVTISLMNQSIPEGEFQVSQNGVDWTTVQLLRSRNYVPTISELTYSFPKSTGKYYRVIFNQQPRDHTDEESISQLALEIVKIGIDSCPRVNHWQEKAAFGITNWTDPIDLDTVPTPSADAGCVSLDRRDVINLTAKMAKDGTLKWNIPNGTWRILRIGYSLTGSTNQWATPEATGLEVDKLSRRHVGNYVRAYATRVADAVGPYFGRSFRYFVMDSWEVGDENWTDDFIEEFRRRCGYDLLPYLPVLTGQVIESGDVSDRVLWDFRRVIADLLAENYYGAAAEYFHQLGIGLYAEAMGPGLPTTGDAIESKGRVDIPMGEFHMRRSGGRIHRDDAPDVREAASAAHIYGKRIVAAESFTSNMPGWALSPFHLKGIADRYLAMGVNRVVFSTAVHQPFVDDKHKPGLTLGGVGQHYGRNVTWAEQSVAWNTYLARSSYLLQQGLYVADLAYYYGEGAPVSVPFWKELLPAPPAGYSYDWLNTEVLLMKMSVQDGRLILPNGMSYRALVLPEDIDQLTVPVTRKIRDLVAAGAIVIAPRPIKSPSLTGYPACDEEIQTIAREVWGSIDGRSITEHDYGKGRVYWGESLEKILPEEKAPVDFQYSRPEMDSELVWIHRRMDDTDIYFVANQKQRTEDVKTSYRVEGREAELWHPDTGAIEPTEYETKDGRTVVPLHLDPSGSVFVVFRKKTSMPVRVLPHLISRELATIQGPWQVKFPPHWGAPPEIELSKLSSWTDSTDEGVKYFSGTATYSKDIEVPQEWLRPGAKVLLDLGRVKEIAEITLNGMPFNTILWKPPFQADITRALRAGVNHVAINITNLWPNRIIGDQQPGARNKYTFTDYQPYREDSPLLESGLLGPVKLVMVISQDTASSSVDLNTVTVPSSTLETYFSRAFSFQRGN
jgi:hypothetical protein